MKKFKKYKYDMVVIRLTDNNEFKKIQEYLFKFGIFWANGSHSYYNMDFYNTHLYIILNNNNNVRISDSPHYLLKSIHYDTYFVNKYNTDPKIYTMNDINKIKLIIEHGGISPTYKPKKLLRCL